MYDAHERMIFSCKNDCLICFQNYYLGKGVVFVNFYFPVSPCIDMIMLLLEKC